MGLLTRLLSRSRNAQQGASSSSSSRTPGTRSLSGVLEILVTHARTLQWVLLLGGVLGLCLVPLLERRIDFDENALLAGSARPTISMSHPSAFESGKTFADSLSHHYNTFTFTAALQEALSSAGWEVSNHTFRTAAAAAEAAGNGVQHARGSGMQQQQQQQQQLECVNVHAVLHSPRADGKEALVLVTPVNHQHFSTDFHQDPSGVRLSLALGYALMSHLSSATWLSKEVIWLIPDASCGLVEAVQAWTDVYQLLPLDHAGSGSPSFKRAGVLQQALLMEVPSGSFNRVQVGLEGHAGQLPKLDMYYLYRWYSLAYVTAPVELPELTPHLPPPLQLIYTTLQPLLPLLPAAAPAAAAVLHSHLHKLHVMWQFMGQQARGLPTGAHAAFKGLGVDAATLRVLVRNDEGWIVGAAGYAGAGNTGSLPLNEVSPHGNGPYSTYGDLGGLSSQQLVGFDSALLQLANVMEASLRSCSVLIERFHHSLFLYVLTGLGHYVSVERYIGPLVALIAVLVLQAAHTSTSSKHVAAAAAEDATASKAEPQQQQQQQQRLQPPSGSLQGLVHAHMLQLPRDQQAAAAERQQWVSALLLVLLTHAAAAAIAAAARNPRGVSGEWGGGGLADGAMGYGGLQGVGVGAGVLMCVVWAGQSVVPLLSCSSSSSSSKVCMGKVLVVELSVAAAVLAAVACINWALGYMTCLVLVPLALACNNSSSSSSSRVGRLLSVFMLVACSPPALLLFLSANSAGVGLGGAFHREWLLWLLRGSSWGTCMVVCGLYMPMWVLAVAASINRT